MKRNLIETIMGAVVLIVAAFFVHSAYQSSGIKKDYGYKLSAEFDKIDGISTGSDVKIGGIKIGTVLEPNLNPATYRAKLTIGVKDDIKLPLDSSAEIASEGLLGGKYVNLTPGADSEMLGDGGLIEYTQSSLNLEELIGKFAFGGAEDKKADNDSGDK